MLDKDEQDLEAIIERGQYQRVADFEDTKHMLEEAAQRYRHLNGSKSITLRVNQLDLIKIKAKAKRNNIPYQTLLGVLLHDFAEDERELSLK
ncbi:hypothetical protein JNM87_02880 [Candidatus Saccharibacteria bacterium]|nr:hypothetical protein [Candidatus Saccharibacteria bacterium]